MLAQLFALALALVQGADDGPRRVVESYPDGARHLEYGVLDVKGKPQKHGAYREWSRDGTLLTDGEYDHGAESGAWTFNDEHGVRRETGTYAKGERTGTWAEFRPDGTKLREGRYARGKRDGRWTQWNADGSVDPTGTGEWRLEVRAWPDGSPRERGYVCNGARVGRWSAFSATGALEWEGEFRADRREGEWTYFRANGATKCRGRCADGALDGEWTSFWDDGQPQVVGRYRAGRPEGEWRLVFPDGRVSRRLFAGAWLEGAWTARTAELAVAPDSQENLAALPRPAPSDETNALQIERIRAAVARAASSEDAVAALAFEELAVHGRAAIPIVLDELLVRGLATVDGAALVKRFDERFFASRFAGASFACSAGGSPEDAADRFEWWRSWYALWMALRDERSWWDIDLRGEAEASGDAPPTEARRAELLAQLERPPIFELEHGAGGAPRFALRAEPRDPRLPPRTLSAVRAGLAWLAAHQEPSGWWDTRTFPELCGRIGRSRCDGVVERQHFCGVTALALLAFLADGNTPEHGPYAAHVSRAVSALLSAQDPRRGTFERTFVALDEHGVEARFQWNEWVYDHALALTALAETLAVSEHAVLRRRLERAVTASLAMRAPLSGFGYALPNDGRCDSSATSWQLAALRTAQWAGLSVQEEAFAGGIAWLDGMTDPSTGRTGYVTAGSIGARVAGVNERFPQTVETLTAGALLARLWAGGRRETGVVERQASLIARSLPQADTNGLLSDAYGWMWCSTALHELPESRHWQTWQRALESAACALQRQDGDARGSWDGFGPWAHAYGRIGSTALCVLALEAPWRFAPADAPAKSATKR
jgi:antitoxin component YwqK of YwqJK toxin-antitoxin module